MEAAQAVHQVGLFCWFSHSMLMCVVPTLAVVRAFYSCHTPMIKVQKLPTPAVYVGKGC
jgi:hypothetical protein